MLDLDTEAVCSPLINLIKNKNNVTYKYRSVDPTYFMTEEEKSNLKGPVGYRGPNSPGLSFIDNERRIIKAETVVEITVKLPKEISEKRLEIAGQCRRHVLTDSVLYDEEEIVKAPYFNNVLSLIRISRPNVTIDDLLYLPDNSGEIGKRNPLFSESIKVRHFDPYHRDLIFDVAYSDFEKDPEKWTKIIEDIIRID